MRTLKINKISHEKLIQMCNDSEPFNIKCRNGFISKTKGTLEEGAILFSLIGFEERVYVFKDNLKKWIWESVQNA